MATRRRSIHPNASSRLNFRPSVNDPTRIDLRGTKPTSQPTSIKEIITLMVLHVCRKSIFFDTNLKVALYLGALFSISLIADVFSIPKGYFSRSSNAFNQYFVKFAWGWNLILLVPYVGLTSLTYCCGQKDRILKHHMVRLAIATFFWWFWTTLFQFIEIRYGKCSVRGEQFNTKQLCLKAGYVWNGFDISGHSFILIYGSLLFIEETRSMVNWDSIKEHIRMEEHYRSTADTTPNNNPLRALNDSQFKYLRTNYDKFTPYIRGNFIIITLFQILWDVMLVTTILYFHVMIEKFIGGICAILTWFFTYKFWYNQPKILPRMPGDGLFKYMKNKQITSSNHLSRKRSFTTQTEHTQLPKFMGMPLGGLRTESGSSPNTQKEEMYR